VTPEQPQFITTFISFHEFKPGDTIFVARSISDDSGRKSPSAAGFEVAAVKSEQFMSPASPAEQYEECKSLQHNFQSGMSPSGADSESLFLFCTKCGQVREMLP
jgi:hypothetical protein